MEDGTQPKNYVIDMDGVLMRGAAPIPGAAEFIGRLEERGAKFLLLTNNSLFTPRDLRLRLEKSGLKVPVESIYTSAMATAQFLDSQNPNGTAFVIGGVATVLTGVVAAAHLQRRRLRAGARVRAASMPCEPVCEEPPEVDEEPTEVEEPA